MMILVEAQVYIPALSGRHTVRLATGAGHDGGRYLGGVRRVTWGRSVSADLPGAGVGGGDGQIEIDDAGGWLSRALPGRLDAPGPVWSWVWDGGDVRIYGVDQGGATSLLRAGVAGPATLDGGSLTIPLRDPTARLDAPVDPTPWPGGGGLGGNDDIAGQDRPVAAGAPRNVSLVRLDSVRPIFDLAHADVDGAVGDAGGLYVGAVPDWPRGPDYASEADLLDPDQAPAAGTYRALPGIPGGRRGALALGSEPPGRVTADLLVGDAAQRRGRAVLARLLAPVGEAVGLTGLPADTVDDLREGVTRRAAVDWVLQSLGAWLYCRRHGGYHATAVRDPGGPALTLTDQPGPRGAGTWPAREIAPAGGAGARPPWRVTVSHARNWTRRELDRRAFEGVLPPDRLDWLAQDRRRVQAEAPDVRAIRGGDAPEVEVDTGLQTAAAAQARADAALARRTAGRLLWQVSTVATPGLLEALDLAATVRLVTHDGVRDGVIVSEDVEATAEGLEVTWEIDA